MKEKIIKISGLIIVIIVAISTWYSPVLFKGYASVPGVSNIIARNIIESGKYSLESGKNIILNSKKVAEHGTASSRGDKLTTIISVGLYKITGVPNINKSVFLSIIIYALALLFFFLTVWRLFSYLQAMIFSAVYIFLPVMWSTSLSTNFYEYGLLFLSIAFLIFFCKWKKNNWFKYILVGIFFALSFLSRDAMLLITPALFVWLWIYNRKAIFPLFASMIATIIIFLLLFQGAFGSFSNNHLALIGISGDNIQGEDFYNYGHLYPDPYTYHYEKENFLIDKQQDIENGGLTAKMTTKGMSNIEPDRISVWHRLSVGPILLLGHLSSIISLENTGGPLVFLLLLLGLWKLYQEKKSLAVFGLLWVGFLFFIYSFIALAARNHVMDFGFMMALLISFGIVFISDLIAKNVSIKNIFLKTNYWIIILLILVIYQLITSSHVTFSRMYDNDTYLKLKAYKEKMLNISLTNDDVIAVPFHNTDVYGMNYLTNESFVKFSNETIEKLLGESKLDFAFKEFGVTKILGFSPEMTSDILTQAEVENITDNSLPAAKAPISSGKTWFMGLVR